MGCISIIFGLISVNAILFFSWLIGGGGENFGVFLGVFWGVMITGGILYIYFQRKSNLKELDIANTDEGKERAKKLLNGLQWTPTGSMQTSSRKYIAFRMHAPKIEDFDWLVKYITTFGYNPNGDIENPYAKKKITLGGSVYTCNSVNDDYTVTDIYRIPISDEDKKLVEEMRFSKTSSQAKYEIE